MRGRASRRSNWLETGILPVLGALMWATWLAFPIDAFLAFVTDQRASGSAGPAVMAILLGATAAARVAQPNRAGRWLAAITGVLAVIGAEWWLLYRDVFAAWDLRWIGETARLSAGPLAVAGIAALLWWRGLTADWTSHDELARDFVIGVIVLGGSLLAAPSTPALIGKSLGLLLLFLSTAWAALSLAAVVQARRRSAAEDRPLKLDRYWLLSVAAIILSLIVFGLVLTALATPEALAAMLGRLRPLGELVLQVMLWVLYVVTYVLFLVLTPLIEYLRSLTGHPVVTPLVPPAPLQDLINEAQTGSTGLAPWVELILRGLLIGGALLVIGLLFAGALRRFASTDDEDVRESRDLIWSWDLLRAQLAELLARQRGEGRPLFPPLGGDPKDRVLRVRAAYRRLLALAVQQGHPRQLDQTPASYLPGVLPLWPSSSPY